MYSPCDMSLDPKPVTEKIVELNEWDQYDWTFDDFTEKMQEAQQELVMVRGCRLDSLRVHVTGVGNGMVILNFLGTRVETDQEARARVKRMKAEMKAVAKLNAQTEAMKQKAQEKRERAQYERLKKKFGR